MTFLLPQQVRKHLLPDSELTWVDPEEAGGAAEELPGERRILLEVTDEDVVQRLRVVDGVEDVGICAHTQTRTEPEHTKTRCGRRGDR